MNEVTAQCLHVFRRIETQREFVNVAYDQALAALQSACDHSLVSECRFDNKDGSILFPRRICETCGLEEESKYTFGSWSVLTTERTKIVSRAAIYRLRK